MSFLLWVRALVVVLAIGFSFSAIAETPADGQVAYDRGDYATALRIWRELADQGYATAQVRLGLMYARGHGVSRDYAEAVRWYRKAAEMGYAWGQTNLGYMYATGRGVPKDDTEAVQWYRMAAEQGFAMAEDNLGVMFRDGRGVEKDDAAAVAWFRKAAEQGYAEGQNSLGFMYESGRGVAKDDAEAAQWYRKAAEQGNTLAQDNLGRIVKKRNFASGTSKCTMVKVDQWPVRFANGLLLIDGAINGHKVGILLDTGLTRTMIFRPVAARLGLTTRKDRNHWVSGVGGDSVAESADVGEFKIGDSIRRHGPMMVAGEHDFGDGIGVVLGEDFFQNVDVEFDLKNHSVRLFEPRNCAGASLAYWTTAGAQEVEIEAINPTRPRIFVPVKINGLPIVALFDSGASTSIVHRVIAGRLGVRPETPGVVVVDKLRGVGKEPIDVWGGPFESFEIGNEAIKTTSIPFGDIGTSAQMLLGTDFLLAHRLLVSHSQRKIYFTYVGGPVFQKPGAPQRGKDQ